MNRRLAPMALLAALIAPLLGPSALAATYQPGEAQAVGPCRSDQLCVFTNPEDIVDLAGSPWLLISQQDVKDPAVGLAALNTQTGQIVRYPSAPTCIQNGLGGGIGVRKDKRGWRLLRIVHSGGVAGAGADPQKPDAIETFSVTLRDGKPVLQRTACLAAPAGYFLNDVAVLADGGFAATHMFDRAEAKEAREAKYLAGEPTGYVVRWSPQGGWRRLPNSDGPFLNGLDVSVDGRWLVFAATYGHAATRIDLDGGHPVRVPLPMNPDNVTPLPDGRFAVAGGTGLPLVSTRNCSRFSPPACGFPAAAMIVDFAKKTAIPIVTSTGAAAPGFSVATVKAGKAYIGGSSSDRITVIPLGGETFALP